MSDREIKPNFVFQLLIAGFCFYCALPFWYSLLDGLLLSDDVMAPLAYGFCSLTGAITLLLLCRKKSISSLLRIGMIIGAVALIGMVFFLIGIRNSVQFNEMVYEQLTYIGGQLTGTDIVSIPDLNILLLLGMSLIIFTLLIYGINRPGQLD